MTLPTEKKIKELNSRLEQLGINTKDLKETFISGSGKGGQKINKSRNGVQLKHIPTNTTIKCHKERSRELNRFLARRMLCDKLEAPQPKNQDQPIHWFPGHMAKATRQLKEQLKNVDCVIEVVDARIPFSSRNPTIKTLCQNKYHLLLINKIDLADPKETQRWCHYYQTQHQLDVLAIDCLTGKNCQKIIPTIESHFKQAKTPLIRTLVAGIPNCGKSALINTLAKRKVTTVQNRPAVTRHQNWITVTPHFKLCDTPGILWPKFELPNLGLKLATTKAIKLQHFHLEDIAFYILKTYINGYPHILEERYKITTKNSSPVDIMTDIGKSRGCFLKNQEIDYDKTYTVLIKDFQNGKLGNITLETPKEVS